MSSVALELRQMREGFRNFEGGVPILLIIVEFMLFRKVNKFQLWGRNRHGPCWASIHTVL
jgi:hypothetical protein